MAHSTIRSVVDSLNRGAVVFEEKDWSALIKGALTGMVTNGEIVRCEHSEFTFYIAWDQKENDSESDVAHRMAKAISGTKRSHPSTS